MRFHRLPPASRGVIDWNSCAGYAPQQEDDYDFSMLKKEWLSQSFLKAAIGGGDPANYWYTVVGLPPDAARPVQTVCSDSLTDAEYIYKFAPDEVAVAVDSTEKMLPRMDPKLKDRRPSSNQ